LLHCHMSSSACGEFSSGRSVLLLRIRRYQNALILQNEMFVIAWPGHNGSATPEEFSKLWFSGFGKPHCHSYWWDAWIGAIRFIGRESGNLMHAL
jgi:hypothetical protein